VNRDFQLDTGWLEKSYVFAAPAHGTSDYVRLGQWHVNGRLAFDDAELTPVLAAHARFADGLELGEAESLRGGVYRFHPQFGWAGANFHRPLLVNRAGFNSDRWIFSPGAELVYRLAVSGRAQVNGRVRVGINHDTAGTLRVEASRDGVTWQTVTNFDGRQRGGVADLPSGLFPAKEIFVRLTQAGTGGGFQVNSIDYEAALAEPLPDAEGATHFLSVLHQAPEMAVRWQALEQSDAEGGWRLDFALTNLTRSPLKLRGSAWLDSDETPEFIERESLQLETSGQMRLACPWAPPGFTR
jgi:hypothetical protein